MGIGPLVAIMVQQNTQRMLMNRRRSFLGAGAPKNDDEEDEKEDRPETPSELDELFNTFLWCIGLMFGVPLVFGLGFILGRLFW